jgi:hypothetical protein
MKNKSLPFICRGIALVVLLSFALTGCVGYRVGSMLPPGIKSIYVPTFINKTTEPMIEMETTSAAIAEFQKDGSLKVAKSAEEADAVLEVKLNEYKLAPLTYDKERTTTANEYRLTLYASIILKQKSTDQIIVESPRVYGESTFPIIGDFTSSKKKALPATATDLAHRIIEKVVETW